MSKQETGNVACEIEYAVFDSLGFNPDSISLTLEMAQDFVDKFCAHHDEPVIRSRKVTEWVTV